MAKSSPTTIVEAWNKKIVPALESGDLSATEQLTLVYTAIALNRNIWEPTKLNAAIIAAATGKDKRTIQRAIERLKEMGVVQSTEEGAIYFGDGKHNRIFGDDTQRDERGAGTSKRSRIENSGTDSGTNDGRDQGSGEADSGTTGTAARKRRLFKVQ